MSKVEQKFKIGDKVVWKDKRYAEDWFRSTIDSVMTVVGHKIYEDNEIHLLITDNGVEADDFRFELYKEKEMQEFDTSKLITGMRVVHSNGEDGIVLKDIGLVTYHEGNEMNIEQQKQLADKVYGMLTLIDPNCVLAGGAPRDWYLGTEANDLDFYFCSTGSTVESVKKQLNRAGFEVEASVCPVQSELYEYMPGLVRIWNCESEAMKIQFIQMADQKYRWDVVSNMDVSICKAWYSHNGDIKLDQDFKLTIASGIMFLKDSYRWSNKHGQKMKNRFTGKFYAGTKEQATNSLVSKVLMGI